MTYSVFIDGAVGTTGLEITDRLAGRSEFTFIALPEERRKDEAARAEALNSADFVILCLPDDAAKSAVAMIDNPDVRVIDASSAHRVADGWTYGFAEIVGHETIAAAKRISNPGCYPSGFIALIAPLVRAGLLPAQWPYTVNAVSGYSGGGKALIAHFEHDQDIAFRAYGLSMGHKHVPEMTRYAELALAPVFSPAVVPAHRGMLVEVPLSLEGISALTGNAAPTADALRACLTDFYGNSPIVGVSTAETPAEILLRGSMSPTDRLDLHVFGAEDNSQVRLVALLDNLGKGASGAAVQNLNILAGLPESAGLTL